MHGLPGQLEPNRQIGQAHGLRLIADGLEDRQCLLNRGAARLTSVTGVLLLGDALDRCAGWALAAKRRRANDGVTRRQPPYSAAELQLTILRLLGFMRQRVPIL